MKKEDKPFRATKPHGEISNNIIPFEDALRMRSQKNWEAPVYQTDTNGPRRLILPTKSVKYTSLLLAMPFPKQTLQLAEACHNAELNEFGIVPTGIFQAIEEFSKFYDVVAAGLPKEWPSDLELNSLQVNYFLERIISASWQILLSPDWEILPIKVSHLGPSVGPEHWLAEHPWARLYRLSERDLLYDKLDEFGRQQLGLWECYLPKDQITFDGQASASLRMTLVNLKKHLDLQSQHPFWQMSQTVHHDHGCFLWSNDQIVPTKIGSIHFQRIEV